MAANHGPVHILVIGGTGQCGQVFIPRALEAGHQLTLYARNPSKFPSETANHSNVKIVQGELTDVEAIKEALGKGAELLVSFVGPGFPFNKGLVSYFQKLFAVTCSQGLVLQPITEFYERLYPLLPDSSVRRCFILSTASYKVPEDKETFKWWFGITFGIRFVGGTAYDEINGLSKATASLPTEIEWTLFRYVSMWYQYVLPG